MCPRMGRVPSGCAGLRSGGGEAGERGRRLDLEPVEDVALFGGQAGGLLDLAGGAGEGDELEALELAAEVAPGVAGLALAEADEQQREQIRMWARMRSSRRW